MLSVKDARERLLAALRPVGEEPVPLHQSTGRVLAETITADLDLPPFSNSAMDGFAVRIQDVAGASKSHPASLAVVADIPAGQVTGQRLAPGQAMRIMTGAAMPPGAEAVVPVEDTDFGVRDPGLPAPERVQVFSPSEAGANVRPQGQDLRAGETILRPGRRLSAADIGILATLGKSKLAVYRQPKVALISTGDELQPVDQPVGPGQIHESNSYTLGAQVESCGGVPLRLGIVPDEADLISSRLEVAVEAGVDLIISSAGVSVGAFDFVRSVVESAGNLDFWRVNMRPGKPLAFGTYREIPFVGLPGNPVSAFVGFEVFLRPAIHHLGGARGWQRPVYQAFLAEEVASDGRESYLRGKLDEAKGVKRIQLTGHQGSGNLLSLVQADLLFIVPAGVKWMPAGAEVSYWRL